MPRLDAGFQSQQVEGAGIGTVLPTDDEDGIALLGEGKEGAPAVNRGGADIVDKDHLTTVGPEPIELLFDHAPRDLVEGRLYEDCIALAFMALTDLIGRGDQTGVADGAGDLDPLHRQGLGMAPVADDEDRMGRAVEGDPPEVVFHHRAGGIDQLIAAGSEGLAQVVGDAVRPDDDHPGLPLFGAFNLPYPLGGEALVHLPVVDQLAERVDWLPLRFGLVDRLLCHRQGA